MFGHPAPSTLETLQRYDTTAYRTDEYGAVSTSADGTQLRIVPIIHPRVGEVSAPMIGTTLISAGD